MNLQRQGRIGFFVPSIGQEASQVGAGYAAALEDWIYPSYRTHSIAINRPLDSWDQSVSRLRTSRVRSIVSSTVSC